VDDRRSSWKIDVRTLGEMKYLVDVNKMHPMSEELVSRIEGCYCIVVQH
jgi:hypothetical protein